MKEILVLKTLKHALTFLYNQNAIKVHRHGFGSKGNNAYFNLKHCLTTKTYLPSSFVCVTEALILLSGVYVSVEQGRVQGQVKAVPELQEGGGGNGRRQRLPGRTNVDCTLLGYTDISFIN